MASQVTKQKFIEILDHLYNDNKTIDYILDRYDLCVRALDEYIISAGYKHGCILLLKFDSYKKISDNDYVFYNQNDEYAQIRLH